MFKRKNKKGEIRDFTFKEATLIFGFIGLIIIAFNHLYFFRFGTQVYAVVNLIAASILLGVPLYYKYKQYRKIKTIETLFPRYLRDVSESISTGMTLPQAMRAATANDYGEMTPFVKALAAKVEWGIPFETAVENFAKQTGSRIMRRNVQTITEAYRSGGKIDTVLKSVASSLQDLERIKKERASSVYAQMINGYLIYVIFLGVMIGLATILVPAFTRFGTSSQADLQPVFLEIFRVLTIIQGLFAGLAIGKMAEGTMVAGIKHALAMSIFGYSAFVLFS